MARPALTQRRRALRRSDAIAAGPLTGVTGVGNRLTDFLGASLAIYGGVSPFRLSPGAVRRSEWLGLAVDVLLDDGQGCASAGDGVVGRRPQVAARAGTHTRTGELSTNLVGGAAFEALGQNGYRDRGRISGKEMDVVGFGR